MTQWTEDQKKVIFSDEKRIICSAAAGSGKTAVMIERIARLIREGADPFSFLVITFTNAAAAEMKEKIRDRLLKERGNPAVAAAAEKAGAMEVCTIHAFCQHLIRQEFQIVGVDPFYQICTGAQREKLFNDAFRKACNELRKQEDPEYLAFIRRYDPETAREIVTTVWQFIMSLPEPFGWLREKTESMPLDYDRDHPWFTTVKRMLNEKLMAAEIILRRQADMFGEYAKVEAYRPVWLEDRERIGAVRRWAEGEEVSREDLDTDLVKLPSPRNLNDYEIDWRERYKNERTRLKELYKEMLSWILADRDRMKREFTEIRNSLRGLARITEETGRFYEQNKARACVLDFTDLEHKALRIMRDENGQAAVRNRYRWVFVDECQDVSSVQNTLIEELAGGDNTLFMVGDVKQSIYRFRMANPNLFRDRMDDRASSACYYLQENFRSRPEILETANTIFRDVMRMEAAEVEYRPEDELRPGRGNCEGQVPVFVDKLVLPEKGMTRLEAIADHTAEQIRKLKEENRYQYRDMVILMPEVSTDGPKLAEMLKERQIPVFFDGKGDFFEQPEVEVFRNLLMLLDNPRQDLPLLTVLVNTPFYFIEEELSLIRLKDTGKNRPFWQAFEAMAGEDSALGRKCLRAKEKLEGWRFLSGRMPLGDFLWYVVENADLYAIFGTSPRGRSAQKNLRNLCLQAEKARDRGICSLREFLAFLSEQASGGEMQTASALADEDQLVRIMTMHKSKGLQFPVVFCLGLDRGLTGKPGGAVRLDADLGICLRYKVPEWRLSRKSAADDIFEWKNAHDVKAEKICLLYVAITRAQEKLFLVGIGDKRPLWSIPPGSHRALAAADYMDWIVPALQDAEKKSTGCSQASKPWKIRTFELEQPKTVETAKDIHNLKLWVETLLSAPPVDDLWKTSPAEADAEKEDRVLQKFSVTSLLREARSRIFMDEEQTAEEKRTPDYVERAMKRYRAGSRPSFSEQPEESGGAARGTVIHRFLSLVDLDAVRKAGGADADALRALRDRLEEEQVFTPEEASWIRPEAVARFFASGLGQRILASPEVHREWDFNLCLRDRDVILQGMIDCAFREGDGWILLDYKTDRIGDEEAFVEEYRPQLAWYAVALRELTGLPVKERWLYALSVDKAFAL